MPPFLFVLHFVHRNIQTQGITPSWAGPPVLTVSFSTVARQIRIVGAPHVKRVRGCIDVAYEWPDTPASGRGSAGLSNITAANILVNGFLQLGRTFFGTVEVSGQGGGGWVRG